MEILFYSISFCPPNSSKSITNSLNFAHGSQARKVKKATSDTAISRKLPPVIHDA